LAGTGSGIGAATSIGVSGDDGAGWAWAVENNKAPINVVLVSMVSISPPPVAEAMLPLYGLGFITISAQGGLAQRNPPFSS
jgi:hypothetical protein